MKTMSQVASIADCPETMEEARGIIAHQHDLITTLRSSDREKTIAALRAALEEIANKQWDPVTQRTIARAALAGGKEATT